MLNKIKHIVINNENVLMSFLNFFQIDFVLLDSSDESSLLIL